MPPPPASEHPEFRLNHIESTGRGQRAPRESDLLATYKRDREKSRQTSQKRAETRKRNQAVANRVVNPSQPSTSSSHAGTLGAPSVDSPSAMRGMSPMLNGGPMLSGNSFASIPQDSMLQELYSNDLSPPTLNLQSYVQPTLTFAPQPGETQSSPMYDFGTREHSVHVTTPNRGISQANMNSYPQNTHSSDQANAATAYSVQDSNTQRRHPLASIAFGNTPMHSPAPLTQTSEPHGTIPDHRQLLQNGGHQTPNPRSSLANSLPYSTPHPSQNHRHNGGSDAENEEPGWSAAVNSGCDDDSDTGLTPGYNAGAQALKINARTVSLKPRKKQAKRQKRRKDNNDEDLTDASDLSTEENDGTRKRPTKSRSIKNLPLRTQMILKKAYENYKKALTTNPWPGEDAADASGGGDELDEASNMAIDAWYDACEMLEIDPEDAEITKSAMRRIRERLPQFRGKLRDLLRAEVEDVYGFKDLKRIKKPTPEALEEARKHNRELVATLETTFWYLDVKNITIPNSMYYNPIIQYAFNANWFGSGTLRRGLYFKGETQVAVETVAFIMSAIACAIDEWKSGSHETKAFRRKEYYENGKKYKAYLKRLTDWQSYCATTDHDLATQFLQGLLRNARMTAGDQGVDSAVENEDEDEVAALAAFKANDI